jgi:Na+-driven multidrug efflux pump
MGFFIYLLSTFMLNFYQISAVAEMHARNVLHVMAFVLWVKVTNVMLIVGILRAGGDTRFGLFLDAGSVWLVGVPLAWIGAFVFHLPVSGVYLLVVSEEFVKFGVALWRFFSRRWIRNLAQTVG